jgi:hypothetical protein
MMLSDYIKCRLTALSCAWAIARILENTKHHIIVCDLSLYTIHHAAQGFHGSVVGLQQPDSA